MFLQYACPPADIVGVNIKTKEQLFIFSPQELGPRRQHPGMIGFKDSVPDPVGRAGDSEDEDNRKDSYPRKAEDPSRPGPDPRSDLLRKNVKKSEIRNPDQDRERDISAAHGLGAAKPNPADSCQQTAAQRVEAEEKERQDRLGFTVLFPE